MSTQNKTVNTLISVVVSGCRFWIFNQSSSWIVTCPSSSYADQLGVPIWGPDKSLNSSQLIPQIPMCSQPWGEVRQTATGSCFRELGIIVRLFCSYLLIAMCISYELAPAACQHVVTTRLLSWARIQIWFNLLLSSSSLDGMSNRLLVNITLLICYGYM